MQLNDPSLLKQHAYLDGAWQDGAHHIEVTNPADGSFLANVPDLGALEARAAIDAAARAWPAWRALTGKARAAVLRRWFDLIVANTDDLAVLMTLEQGKPLAESRGEIAYAASFVEWFAEEAKRVDGDVLASPMPGKRLLVLRQPVGVCAAITPWNFPAAMITRKVAPALAAGCTVVVKPAEQTPLTALALAELAARAGFPAGVMNVITGDAATIGGELTAHPTVRKLSFTGSTEVGRLLMRQCADTVKKLSLELGGNAPFIVFDDADLDAAVEGALASKYRNTGQTCVCANRLLVQDGVYDDFAARLAAQVKTLKVGGGFEAHVAQGPLIDVHALAKVEAHVADALDKGARLLTGGARHERGGTFYQPTVLGRDAGDALHPGRRPSGRWHRCAHFNAKRRPSRLANDTIYGLASYFYYRYAGRCHARRRGAVVRHGGCNTGIISNEVAPFGGVKQSGLGREGSRYGIDEYLEMKYLCLSV